MSEDTNQLVALQAELLATAHDLKIDVPDELKTDTPGEHDIAALEDLIKVTALDKSEEKEQKAPRVGKTKQEKSVTTKKPAKKAKAAKKPAKAKKTKAAAKTKAKKSTGNGRGYPEDAKIQWLGKDNPARKTSGRFQRIENIKKHSGKTVKTFLASKGLTKSLTWCVKEGLIKVAA